MSELPNILDGTEQFMRASEQAIASVPGFPDIATRELRRELLDEEVLEYFRADHRDDLVETVDGLLDIIVVAWGTLLAYVSPEAANAAAAEVTRSNLAKVVEGKVLRREDGKVKKPPGWTPPDIAGVLAAFGWDDGGIAHTRKARP